VQQAQHGVQPPLAQAAALLGFHSEPGLRERGGGVVLLGLDGVRFRRKVVPGDVLRLEVTVTQKRGKTWKVQARSTVGGERAAEAEILAAFVDGPGAP
jgi:3-hydroxyacyl-[acyl-carrier-protein] dehydratase